jgi:glycosyltransferase involved in cell wall biosynthesis
MVEFSPSGGLFHFALQMAEALAQAGHSVELITGPDPELSPRVPGVRLVPILPTWHPGSTGPKLVRKARRVVRAVRHLESWRRVAVHLRRSRPDVVQWAELRFAIDGAVVAWLAGRRDAPVMVDVVHEPRPVSHRRRRGGLHRRSPLLRSGLSAAYRRMDAVLVLGDGAAAAMRRAWPDVRRVEVMPHGDEGVFAALAQAPVPAADATPPVVLFFGTWTRYKGLDLLLDAFELLRRDLPDARLVLAGAPAADVDVITLLGRAAAIGGVDARPGYVPSADVAGLVGSSRVVVAPYLTATQSGVVHVAQTFCRPVVATDVGDLAAVVRHGETGLLVPAGDAQALAWALARLLSDPAEAARLGRNAQRRLAEEGSWTQVAARVAPLYAELVA